MYMSVSQYDICHTTQDVLFGGKNKQVIHITHSGTAMHAIPSGIALPAARGGCKPEWSATSIGASTPGVSGRPHAGSPPPMGASLRRSSADCWRSSASNAPWRSQEDRPDHSSGAPNRLSHTRPGVGIRGETPGGVRDPLLEGQFRSPN